MKSTSSNISRILATTLLMFLFIGIFAGLYNYDETKQKEERYLADVKEVRELQWEAIESIIISNYNSAEIFGEVIKSNIEVKVLDAYPNKVKLQFDLDNPNQNAAVYSIFAQEIKGKYLNHIQNDNNDPFIASKSGVLSDLSLNCSGAEESFRSWEKEISLHNNTTLATKAIHAVVYQVNKPIFWEFKISENPNHLMITEMELRELKNVFMKEGMRGLETYEFLKPVYIQQHNDIFGVPDVNSIGNRTPKNSKIIVVSGFNIVDVINEYHRISMNKYDVTVDKMGEYHNLMVHRSNVINVVVCSVLLFCIIFTAIINNYVVSVIRRKDCD